MESGPPPFCFDHAAASVPDLDAAIAWYGRVLGFTVARRFELPRGVARAAMLECGDLRVELFEPRRGEPLPEARRHPDIDVELHGNKHVAFRSTTWNAGPPGSTIRR
jgi:methylmalonyl-CoA/ethylmalonyl-CoA epimerase